MVSVWLFVKMLKKAVDSWTDSKMAELKVYHIAKQVHKKLEAFTF